MQPPAQSQMMNRSTLYISSDGDFHIADPNEHELRSEVAAALRRYNDENDYRSRRQGVDLVFTLTLLLVMIIVGLWARVGGLQG